MVTVSPFLTPCRRSAEANWFTSRQRSRYVSTRLSPGSPSQMMAALFLRGPSTCRSRQLSERLSLPPINHFAYGSFQSSVFFHGFIHRSCLACFSQNRTESRAASLETDGDLTRAFFTKSFGGGNFLPSFRSAWIGSACPALAIRAPRRAREICPYSSPRVVRSQQPA